MRLSKAEVERRHQVVLSYFRKNPKASVAKMNAALCSGELTGKPEKMLNIATGYQWRKEAVATPELPNVCADPSCAVVGEHATKEVAPGVKVRVHETAPEPQPNAVTNVVAGLNPDGTKLVTATDLQPLVDALKMPEPPEGLKVESIVPICEIAVRTGPVELGGNGEDPKAVIREVLGTEPARSSARFYNNEESE